MNLNKFIANKKDAENAIIGTVLCDGSIGKQRTDGSVNGTNADMEITHTSKNLDYLRLKKALLDIIGIESKITEHNKKTSEKTYSLYRLSTHRHRWITSLRTKLYDEKRNKLLPQDVVDNLSELALFFMYLDDGTLRVRCYEGTSKIRECRVTFCFDRFTINEILYFRKHLKEKYDIDSNFYRHSKNMPKDRGYRVWTNTQNTQKFMNLFDKYYELVPSMQYKFVKYYSL